MIDIDQAIKILTAVGVIIGVVSSFLNRQKIYELHITLNSRLDELLKSSIAQARSEGMAEAREMDKIDPAVTAQAAAKVLDTAAHAAVVLSKEKP